MMTAETGDSPALDPDTEREATGAARCSPPSCRGCRDQGPRPTTTVSPSTKGTGTGNKIILATDCGLPFSFPARAAAT